MNLKVVAGCFPLVVLAVVASYHFLDERIALAVMELLKSSDLLQAGTANIPDVLGVLVCLGSGLLWGNYLIHRRRGIVNEHARFSRFAGSVLPLSYALKWFFKYVFGRTNTRAWLANQANNGFHWFTRGADYSGFPSGHMAVFAAFFAAVWLFYPRYRVISVGMTLLLAVALIITDYHFLSDVIAGAYLGLATTSLARGFWGARFADPGA